MDEFNRRIDLCWTWALNRGLDRRFGWRKVDESESESLVRDVQCLSASRELRRSPPLPATSTVSLAYRGKSSSLQR